MDKLPDCTPKCVALGVHIILQSVCGHSKKLCGWSKMMCGWCRCMCGHSKSHSAIKRVRYGVGVSSISKVATDPLKVGRDID
jgi:hypothetical protein